MLEKEYVIQKRGISNILFSSNWTIRSASKHLITCSYIVLITLILFKVNAISMNFSVVYEIVPRISWYFLMILIEVQLMRQTMLKLQVSTRNLFVFLPFSLICFGYGIFIAIFGTDYVLTFNETVLTEGLKKLSLSWYFGIPLPCLWVVWNFSNALNEKNVSPFIAKLNFHKAIMAMISVIITTLSFVFAKNYFLDDTSLKFNYHDLTQMSFVLFVSILVMLLISYSGLIFFSNRKLAIGFATKNTSLAMATSLIAPITIWMFSHLGSVELDWRYGVYICLVIIVTLIIVLYSFVRRTELASPIIYSIAIASALSVIWSGRFFFGFFWSHNPREIVTLLIALVGTTIIILTMYIKSPDIKKSISWWFLKFVWLIWLSSCCLWASWALPSEITAVLFESLPEMLNIILLVLPILMTVFTTIFWYITQFRMKAVAKHKEVLNV